MAYGFNNDKSKADVYRKDETYDLDDLFVLRCTVATNETINSKQSKFLSLQLPSYIDNLAYYIGVIDAQFYDSNDNRLSLTVCGLVNTIYSASGRGVRVYNPTDTNVTIDKSNSDILLICARRSKSKSYLP